LIINNSPLVDILVAIIRGVEAEAQRQLLQAAGCDYGQGYLFMRPVPAAKFEHAFLMAL
jgi:EAL domain-containing protein (putative c-di-GMP-specific phosphodiesterase class I)